MRILLTGAKGQIGRSIKDRQPDNWEMIAADSKTLDITNEQAVTNMVANFEPNVIINTAGYTHLDSAETLTEQVFAVNAQGVANLARAAGQANIRLIHISSDYVFDGHKHSAYTESDYPNPLSTYAKSKLAGELLALSLCPKSIVIRSSWVFSEYGHNFVKETVASLLRREAPNVSAGKTGCPTYAGDLAQFIIEAARNRQLAAGIYHYCGDVPVSRGEFAQLIAHNLDRELSEHTPIAEADTHDPTHRPDHNILCCDKIIRAGYQPSDWQTALKHLVPQIAAQMLSTT